MSTNRPLDRRRFISAATSTVVIGVFASPLRASDRDVLDAVSARFGEAKINTGRVNLDLPALAENGNSVALTVSVDSPMRDDDYVRVIHVFAPANPLPDVASFYLTPASGRAQVTTRIRLGGSQTLTAIAEMHDGTLWSGTAKTVVTLAACIEPLI